MNFNNFDGAPATNPRLINNPRRHNNGSHFGGAATPYHNMQQPRLVDTEQSGSAEALHPSPSSLNRCDSTYQETTSMPASEWNNGYDYGAGGAYGGVNLEQEPPYANPPLTSHTTLPSEGASSSQRTVRMYELPPQSDPHLEKRRKRALRQRHLRQREQQEAEQLQRNLDDAMREVIQLTPEALRLRQQVQMLEQYAAQQGYYGGR